MFDTKTKGETGMSQEMEQRQKLAGLWPDQRQRVDKTLRLWESAVLLPLRWTKHGWEILFEVRAANMSCQPGDICFPGGHREDSDPSFCATALRETREELGIPEDKIQVLGPLDYFYGYSGPMIYPFAGILPSQVSLQLDKQEVGEVFSVPLKDLLAIHPVVGKLSLASRQEPGFPSQWAYGFQDGWNIRGGYEVFFYPWKKRIIWGITGRILHQFLERVRQGGILPEAAHRDR